MCEKEREKIEFIAIRYLLLKIEYDEIQKKNYIEEKKNVMVV